MDKLLNLLLDRQKELKDGLVDQPAQTLHDYHRRVGEVNGLQQAIDILADLMAPDED